MPRRIEVPSADALFGGPPVPPPAAAATGSTVEVRPLAPRPRRPRRPALLPRADQGAMRRLEELEATLAELPVDRLIELREGLETLLAAGSVDAESLERVLELGSR